MIFHHIKECTNKIIVFDCYNLIHIVSNIFLMSS